MRIQIHMHFDEIKWEQTAGPWRSPCSAPSMLRRRSWVDSSPSDAPSPSSFNLTKSENNHCSKQIKAPSLLKQITKLWSTYHEDDSSLVHLWSSSWSLLRTAVDLAPEDEGNWNVKIYRKIVLLHVAGEQKDVLVPRWHGELRSCYGEVDPPGQGRFGELSSGEQYDPTQRTWLGNAIRTNRSVQLSDAGNVIAKKSHHYFYTTPLKTKKGSTSCLKEPFDLTRL